MTWRNHVLISAGGYFALTGDLGSTVLASVGAVFPDLMESPLKPLGIDKKLLAHRGISHSLLPWSFLSLISFAFPSYQNYFLAFFFGIFSHLFLDGLSKSGVPLLPIYQNQLRFQLKLYKTKTFSEEIVAFCFLLPITAFIGYTKFIKI